VSCARVVSWKLAAEMNESVESKSFVMLSDDAENERRRCLRQVRSSGRARRSGASSATEATGIWTTEDPESRILAQGERQGHAAAMRQDRRDGGRVFETIASTLTLLILIWRKQ
jgi:hypothetical protein